MNIIYPSAKSFGREPDKSSRHCVVPRLYPLLRLLVTGLFALFFCARSWAIQGEPVPVVDGGFENAKSAWVGGSIVNTERHEGAKALSLASGFAYQAPAGMVPIKPGFDYRLHLWIKCDACNAHDVAVSALLRGEGFNAASGNFGEVLGSWLEGTAPAFVLDGGKSPALLSVGGTTGWKEYTAVIPAAQIPPNTKALQIYLRHDTQPEPKGTAYFDDLSIERLPAGSLAPDRIILNGGFEAGKAPWWGDGDIIKDNVAEGHSALRIKAGFAAQDKRPVEGGKRYRVSMQIRSNGAPDGSVFVQLSFRGTGVDAGWRGPEQVNLNSGAEAALFVTGGTHAWKPYSVVVEAPPGANEVVLYLRKKAATPGTADFDAVAVSPTNEPVTTAAVMKQKTMAAAMFSPAVKKGNAEKIIAAAVAAGAGKSPASLLLADNGHARYHIHVARNADAITLGAAATLADYLKRISGAGFASFSDDDNPQAGPLLVVGRDNILTKRLCPDISYDKLGEDGFVIRTVGPHLVIAGATPRGTMYGVNWFLDRKLGVKWLSPSYTYVPAQPKLQVARLNTLQVPRFSYREVLSYEGQDKLYRAHNLLNGESHGPSFSASPPEIDSWDHSWDAKGGEASFYELMPQDQYAKAHPDWYAGGQVAMMNPQVRQVMAEAIVNRLKQLPDYKKVWFDLHDMDWGWDMDPASKAFADKHGGEPSAPRLDMVIDIANRVRQVLPGARLAFNAYHWSFTPPKGMTVPDYVMVFPMTIQVDYSSPLNQGRNQKLGQDIAGWNAIAKHILVWDHITNFSGFLQPTSNIYPIGHSLQWLATLPNVHGYFAEGSWNTPAAEFASLRVWMIARLLWDPKQDVRALVAEYCRYYFGAASPYVLQYIDLMHAAIAKSRDVLSEKTQVDVAMLNLDFVRAADQLFEKAQAAVANNPVFLEHVKEARMPVDYVILVRRKEYADEAAQRGIHWQPDTAKRLARFNQTIRTAKVSEYRQGGNIKELDELLAVERRTPQAPAMVRDLAKSDWVDFQDLSFNRYESAQIVQDKSASDGAAARMNGDSSTWAVQFKLDKLPKQGRWELYASVRVDAATNHDKDVGAKVGYSPPMGLFNAGLIGTLNDGRYHFIKVPGGPFRYDTDQGKGVYIQAPGEKYVKYVYVDRFIAVRVPDKH
ncbi:DUF4838 domain-containing protein [Sulfuriferula sp. GW1]|uniref:DUF4838 domain-containing protein n=1 Tax=Sulfuriferula sp. GW1 TaxID=3345111 RepID=UPI0039B00CC6